VVGSGSARGLGFRRHRVMTPNILVLLGGLAFPLVGVCLLGTLLGVRASIEAFGALFTGLIMAGYYAGYIIGTWLAPRIIRNVGHIRSFAAFASVGSATSLAFGLVVDPWVWLVLRIANGLCVLGLYMVVESWLNEQSAGPTRGRIFSVYMASTLVALGLGQFLLLLGDTAGQTLFSVAAILICIGVVPVAITSRTLPCHTQNAAPARRTDRVHRDGTDHAGGPGDASGCRPIAGARASTQGGLGADQRPAAPRRASALSVRSQVNSGSSRPKCPLAAVLR